MIEQFQNRLDTILATWRDTRASTLDAASLDPAPTAGAIDGLRKEIIACLQAPTAVAESVLEDLSARAIAEIKKQATAVRGEIEKLANLDITRADACSRDVDEKLAMAETGMKRAEAADLPKESAEYMDLLKDSMDTVRDAIASRSEETSDRQGRIAALIKAADQKLAAFNPWIEKRPKIVRGPADIRGDSQEANYGQMRDAFARRLEEATAVAGMSSTGVLKQATAALEILCDDIDWALEAARVERGKGSMDHYTMADFIEAIDQGKSYLDGDKVATFRATNRRWFGDRPGNHER